MAWHSAFIPAMIGTYIMTVRLMGSSAWRVFTPLRKQMKAANRGRCRSLLPRAPPYNALSVSTQVRAVVFSSAYDGLTVCRLACVMNLITFDSAYSLYPRATFEERRTLALHVRTPGEELARSKYVDRGWRLQTDLWPHDERNPKLAFYLGTLRTMGDKLSWVVPLDTTGVDMRPALTELSPVFQWDPVIYNSWRLARNRLDALTMAYRLIKSTVLRYNYMIEDTDYFDMIINFLETQGRAEHSKRSGLSEEEIESSITW